MTSPLYPTFRKRIDDAIELLVQRQITPWAFMHSGKPMRVKTFTGNQIAYEGGRFEGSSRDVFWGRYIEPFLEDLAASEIKAAVAMAQERVVDGRTVLLEVGGMLKAGCAKVYQEMAIIDQRLRGKGYPHSVNRRFIDNELAMMTGFIDQHVNAELSMWKPKSRLEEWYARHKFWVWLLPPAVGLAVALLQFL